MSAESFRRRAMGVMDAGIFVKGSVENVQNLVPPALGANQFEVRRAGWEHLALNGVRQAPRKLEAVET